MIAKRIAMNSVRKSSYAGLVTYITSSQGKSERVGEIRITNFQSDDVDWAVQEALAVQAQNKRAQTDKTYHLLIALAPGESPAPEILRAIEDRLCGALGYTDHQRISAVHRDTDCVHIHIAINKIHPARLTLHQPYRDYRLLGEACAQLETEFGLQHVDHSRRKSTSQNRADDMEQHSGTESLIRWARRECLPSLQAAATWAEMHQALQAAGLHLVERGNGLVLVAGQGLAVKASSVARDLSKAQLEARLGAFETATGTTKATPRRRYEGRPLRSRIDTSELYAAYQAEQSAARTHKSAAMHLARLRRSENVEAAKRAGRLRRAAIKLLGGSAGNKRLLYALASRSLLAEVRRAQEVHRGQREAIAAHYVRRAWADWLRAKAQDGQPQALQALRARDCARGLAGETLQGQGSKREAANSIPVRDSVTKQGTVIFLTASTALRDDGTRLKVSTGADREGLVAALGFAAQRYGNQITVNGGAEFKERVAIAAASARLPITFADVRLERQRQALTHILFEKERNSEPRIQGRGTGRSDGAVGLSSEPQRSANRRAPFDRKSNLGQVAAGPPPETTNGLRNLSQLRVVRIDTGGPVLLPRDVPRHVEHRNAEPHPQLRRPISDLAASSSARIAAERYVAERQIRRADLFDIPKHTLYTAGLEATASYAGTRTIDGQALALLRQRDGIAVLPVDGATANRLRRLSLGQPVAIAADGTVRTKGRGR